MGFRAELTRRHFLSQAGFGLGALALNALLVREGRGAARDADDGLGGAGNRHPPGPLTPRAPHFAPKAKAVIYLHMIGGPSQLDLFDWKPTLVQHHGEECPESLLKGKRFAFIRGTPRMLGTPFKFAQHGQSGAWVSELLPHLASQIDQIALIRSMTTDQFNHAPAELFLHTGTPQFGGAAMGSWITYGLGSAADDLPGFVVLLSGGKAPSAGKSLWASGYLSSVHQGVQCRSPGPPVLFAEDPPGLDRGGRRATLDTLRELNEIALARHGDPETLARIEQYELAFRMQTAVPEVMDLSREPAAILEMYGARPGHRSNSEGVEDPRALMQGDDPQFANHCLLARRLVEHGVRFVQLYDWGWDHHGVAPGEDIDHHLPVKCRQIDRAVTALLTDLAQRGLLDETLVIWGGEFGRTPMRQNAGARYLGRDHHPDNFCLWMAGGGVKAGVVHGETDELGASIVKDRVHVRDLQATLLHLLGLDAWKLRFPYQGLEQRLIGPEGKARVVSELLA